VEIVVKIWVTEAPLLVWGGSTLGIYGVVCSVIVSKHNPLQRSCLGGILSRPAL